MRPASVVIVGAGVMGASVAYHLAARGWRDVLLVDRSDGPGRGSTGAATGGFRAQYGTAINVRLSLFAREKFLRFRDEIGVAPGYLPAGYLWLAGTRAELDILRAALEVQQAEGLHEATEVSVEDSGCAASRCSGGVADRSHRAAPRRGRIDCRRRKFARAHSDRGRARDGRVLVLWPTPGVTGKPFDISVDREWIDTVTAMAHRRVPILHHVAIDAACCRAGLYEMSPDRHALLGPAPGCDNFFLINGSSGHGVMHAPALGQLLAEIMSDGAASSLDVGALRPSRFAEGRPNPVSGLL